MNARKSKSMRRAVRASGHHPRHVELASGNKPTYIAPLIPGMGPGCMFLGQRVLLPSSGRAIYRMLKKAVRQGVPMPA